MSASKGANYPVMTLNERVLNVCACKWVDEAIHVGQSAGQTVGRPIGRAVRRWTRL